MPILARLLRPGSMEACWFLSHALAAPVVTCMLLPRMTLLLEGPLRPATALRCEPSHSGRCWPCAAPRLGGRGAWAPLPRRRSVLQRAEFSRDPRLGGGAGGGAGGQGPATYPQPQQQQPWPDSYDYAPQPSAGQPPRLPPLGGGNGSGPDGGGGGSGLSNLTKAFIAGAFILGAWAASHGRSATAVGAWPPRSCMRCCRHPGTCGSTHRMCVACSSCAALPRRCCCRHGGGHLV